VGPDGEDYFHSGAPPQKEFGCGGVTKRKKKIGGNEKILVGHLLSLGEGKPWAYDDGHQEISLVAACRRN